MADLCPLPIGVLGVFQFQGQFIHLQGGPKRWPEWAIILSNLNMNRILPAARNNRPTAVYPPRQESKRKDSFILGLFRGIVIASMIAFCLFCIYSIDVKGQHEDVFDIITDISNSVRDSSFGQIFNQSLQIGNNFVEGVQGRVENANEDIKGLNADYHFSERIVKTWQLAKNKVGEVVQIIKGRPFGGKAKEIKKMAAAFINSTVEGVVDPLVVVAEKVKSVVTSESSLEQVNTVVNEEEEVNIETVTVNKQVNVRVRDGVQSPEEVVQFREVTEQRVVPESIPSQTVSSK